jgi:hypothetical protein
MPNCLLLSTYRLRQRDTVWRAKIIKFGGGERARAPGIGIDGTSVRWTIRASKFLPCALIQAALPAILEYRSGRMTFFGVCLS